MIICLFLAQKYLYKNMNTLNRFDTSCGKSIIPFHAICGLCSYNICHFYWMGGRSNIYPESQADQLEVTISSHGSLSPTWLWAQDVLIPGPGTRVVFIIDAQLRWCKPARGPWDNEDLHISMLYIYEYIDMPTCINTLFKICKAEMYHGSTKKVCIYH